MFQDEAGFGSINKPKRCWCPKGIRTCVPCHHIREYRYAYDAVEPLTGESFFLILPYSNTECMKIFLQELSEAYAEDMILLAVDNASWHHSKSLDIPDNIQLFYLLPYTPEMNPIEQIWKEIRKIGFKLRLVLLKYMMVNTKIQLLIWKRQLDIWVLMRHYKRLNKTSRCTNEIKYNGKPLRKRGSQYDMLIIT